MEYIRRTTGIILCLRRERYNSICNVISEYARLDSEKEQRVIWVKENCEAVIKANAISKVKKYL